MIEISPKSLLDGTTPRSIDEWQALPPIWDSIRSEVDKRGEPSQFILTGSSVLPDADETIHSGTGRFAHIMMRPMSLYESGESSGAISLKDLFDGKTPEVQLCNLNLDDIAFLTCRGGWPWATLISKKVALDQAFDYIDTDKMPAPTFMAVIIGVGKYAYQRQDGVYVIPIGCLKD